MCSKEYSIILNISTNLLDWICKQSGKVFHKQFIYQKLSLLEKSSIFTHNKGAHVKCKYFILV